VLGTEFSALGDRPSPLFEAYHQLLNVFELNTWNILRYAFPSLDYLPIAENMRQKRAARMIFNNAQSMIQQLQSTDHLQKETSLMQILMDETNQLSLEEIRDELNTFLIAGMLYSLYFWIQNYRVLSPALQEIHKRAI
jgi:cytochrome P450